MSRYISVTNEESCSGKRSDTAAYEIRCRTIVKSSHRDHFTLSRCQVQLAARNRAFYMKRYRRTQSLSFRSAEVTVSN